MTDAATLTRDLGGKWYRRYGCAACPCCQPEHHKSQNALTLADGTGGRLLLNCKKSDCAFTDILAAAGLRSGDYQPPDPATHAQREAEQRAEAEKRAGQAHRLWQDAQPIGGTVAETYLRSRGITCDLPQTLRFVASCWHPTAKRFPAMMAAVQGCEKAAVHRTYLRADGSDKADVEPAKAMLGSTQGGAVRLSEGPGPLLVCEGIETGLSLLCGLLCTPATVWAALSTGGMRGIHLPPEPGRLTIATDSDDGGAGASAGYALATKAHGLGWQVSLLPAPEGRDWNDVLRAKAVAA